MEGRDPEAVESRDLVLERIRQPGDVADAVAGSVSAVAESGRLSVVDLCQLDEERAPRPERRGMVVYGRLRRDR